MIPTWTRSLCLALPFGHTAMAKEENLFGKAVERALPASLFWVTQPFKWIFDRDLRLCIVASPQTNLYNPVGLGKNVQPIESACFLASKRAGKHTPTAEQPK
jgi:hypothetical protein